MPQPPDLPARVLALPALAPVRSVLDGVPGVWIVGGAVRDVLLGGAAPVDLDLVVEGDSEAVAGRLAAGIGGSVVVHDRFGTATVSGDGFSFDVARARSETYSRPGALPDVRPASLGEDLGRRDFTVNAIAVGLDGRVASAPGAFSDLDARVLRVLHDVSFVDDPTRLLRLVRYATRLGFGVAPSTAALASAAVAGGALSTVTPSRLGNELRLLLREPAAAEGVAWLADERPASRGWRPGGGGEGGAAGGPGGAGSAGGTGLPAGIGSAGGAGDPGGTGSAGGAGFAGESGRSWGDWLVPGFSFDRGLADRARGLLPADGRDDLLLLAVAVLGAAQPGLPARLDALGFTARDRDTVVVAAGEAARVAERLRADDAERPSRIAAALRGAPVELAALAGALGPAEPARAWIEELRHVSLSIDGAALLAAGVPQGPAVGRALAAALDAKLDGLAPDADAELRVALAAVP